jgi:hypothetical protein
MDETVDHRLDERLEWIAVANRHPRRRIVAIEYR